MSCERHHSAIVDHAFGAEIDAGAAAHLESCAACRGMFDEQRRLSGDLDRELQAALEIEPSARFVPQVLARVERPESRRREITWWAVPLAAAAILVLIVFGALRWRESRAEDPSQVAVSSPRPSGSGVDRPVPRTPDATDVKPPARATTSPRPDVGDRNSTGPTAVASKPDGVERPSGDIRDVAPQTDLARALARYLALVRDGALDTSALANAGEQHADAPEELVIAPIAIDPLPNANLPGRIVLDVEPRDAESR